MWPLDISSLEIANVAMNFHETSSLWHMRFGHLNFKGLKLLVDRDIVKGMPNVAELKNCEDCIVGKSVRQPFQSRKVWRATDVLQLVHPDVCGPMNIESLRGSRYFLLLVDDHSRINWVFCIKCKSVAFKCFRKFKVFVEKQLDHAVKALRIDRD